MGLGLRGRVHFFIMKVGGNISKPNKKGKTRGRIEGQLHNQVE